MCDLSIFQNKKCEFKDFDPQLFPDGGFGWKKIPGVKSLEIFSGEIKFFSIQTPTRWWGSSQRKELLSEQPNINFGQIGFTRKILVQKSSFDRR